MNCSDRKCQSILTKENTTPSVWKKGSGYCQKCRNQKIKETRKSPEQRIIQRNYMKEKYSKFRLKLDKIKISIGCADCGYNKHPAALDFDHINSKEKFFKVASAASRKWEIVLLEIAKCEVRCANCHRIKHQRKAAGDGVQLS